MRPGRSRRAFRPASGSGLMCRPCATARRATATNSGQFRSQASSATRPRSVGDHQHVAAEASMVTQGRARRRRTSGRTRLPSSRSLVAPGLAFDLTLSFIPSSRRAANEFPLLPRGLDFGFLGTYIGNVEGRFRYDQRDLQSGHPRACGNIRGSEAREARRKRQSPLAPVRFDSGDRPLRQGWTCGRFWLMT